MRLARRYAPTLLRALVRGADDARLERRFGSRAVQRALFAAMASGFDPVAAEGFEGRLVYELRRPATGRPPTRWTIDVVNGRAAVRPGGAIDAVMTVRYGLADFVRVAAGTLDPAVPMLQDRASFDGDLVLAARLPEMFGAGRLR
jgi:hypothetical protein